MFNVCVPAFHSSQTFLQAGKMMSAMWVQYSTLPLANTSRTRAYALACCCFSHCLIRVTYHILLGESQHWHSNQLLSSRQHKEGTARCSEAPAFDKHHTQLTITAHLQGAVHSPLLYFEPRAINAVFTYRAASKLWCITLHIKAVYLCGVLTRMFLDLLIVSVAGSLCILVISPWSVCQNECFMHDPPVKQTQRSAQPPHRPNPHKTGLASLPALACVIALFTFAVCGVRSRFTCWRKCILNLGRPTRLRVQNTASSNDQ